MKLVIVPILSVVLLILLFAFGHAAEAPLQEALAVSDGLERPLILALQFFLTNPVGIFIIWMTGTFSLLVAAVKTA